MWYLNFYNSTKNASPVPIKKKQNCGCKEICICLCMAVLGLYTVGGC